MPVAPTPLQRHSKVVWSTVTKNGSRGRTKCSNQFQPRSFKDWRKSFCKAKSAICTLDQWVFLLSKAASHAEESTPPSNYLGQHSMWRQTRWIAKPISLAVQMGAF